jgi:hypothetical protein
VDGTAPIELVLQVAGDHWDADQLDRATRSLLAELRDLPIEARLGTGGPPPSGAKAAQLVPHGELLLAALPVVLGSVVTFLQSWLRRGNGKTLKLKWSDGKRSVALELPAAAYSHDQLTELLARLGVSGEARKGTTARTARAKKAP